MFIRTANGAVSRLFVRNMSTGASKEFAFRTPIKTHCK